MLKIDIEGSEWDFFENSSPEALLRFRQIAVEFHDFELYWDTAWWERARRVLAKLNAGHQLIHLHGNNCEPTFWTGEVDFPHALELTYVLRSRHHFEETTEPFPGPLDFPNSEWKKEDLRLEELVRLSRTSSG